MPRPDISEERAEVRTHSALRAWWLCKIKGYRLKVQVKSEPVPTTFRRIRYNKTWVLEQPASDNSSSEEPTIEQDEPRLENECFKQCNVCGFVWPTRNSMLSDANMHIVGYQVNFIELLAGLFLFNHSCGGTLAFEASWFEDLYDGPVFAEPLTGTDECPEYCLLKEELRPCPALCECAFVREIIQIIKNWPKAEEQRSD